MCKNYINWNAIPRSRWVLIAKIFGLLLILASVTLGILYLIDLSNRKCDGVFGDTFGLNFKDHVNYKEFTKGMCEEQCKDRNSQDDIQEFSFIARLVSKNETKPIICGGSLITQKLVITAAHCVDGLSPNSLEIYVGTGNAKDLIRRPKFQIIMHPQYNPETYANDIALIKFNNNVILSTRINLICLPFDDSKVPINMTLSKYSSMSFDDSELKEMFIQGIEDCNTKYFEFSSHRRQNEILTDRKTKLHFKPINPINQFCGGNKTLAQGNSGMPVYARNDKGQLRIYGLVSYGTKMNESKEFPTVFTKVNPYIHWILCNASS